MERDIQPTVPEAGRFATVDTRRSGRISDERGMPSYDAMRSLFQDERAAVEYLIEQRVAKVALLCSKCEGEMSWHRSWPAPGTPLQVHCLYRRCKSGACRSSISIFRGTPLERFSKPKNEFLHFVYLWLCGDTTTSIRSKLRWSEKTIQQWTLYLREVCMIRCLEEMQPIGGPGIEVQIDESKFGKCKYGRGRKVQGTWVFGGVEVLEDGSGCRRAGKCFAVAVPDRTASTLLPILLHYVRAGSYITSDKWKAYENIRSIAAADGSQVFTHGSVNHSQTFKDPVTGVNTNIIEGQWRWMKNSIPNRVYHNGDKVQSFLFQYMWNALSHGDRWNVFMQDLRHAKLS